MPDLLNSLEFSRVVVLHVSLLRTAEFDGQLAEGVAVDGHGQFVDPEDALHRICELLVEFVQQDLVSLLADQADPLSWFAV